MLFWLKKLLTLPFLPLHFALFAGAFGAFLLWRTKREKLGRIFVSLALAALAIFSNKGVALLLLRPLESRFESVPEVTAGHALPPEIAACRYVVVLGGGHADNTPLSRINQLSTPALSRLAEAIRVLRLLPAEAKLIVSGHNGDRISHAQVLAEAAVSLGVDPARIVRMDEPRDTEDEARGIERRLGRTTPFALVTSAWHMPRSMALCRGLGLSAVACPADFMLKPGADAGWGLLQFDLGALERSTKAIHEYLGLLWVTARGKTSAN